MVSEGAQSTVLVNQVSSEAAVALADNRHSPNSSNRAGTMSRLAEPIAAAHTSSTIIAAL